MDPWSTRLIILVICTALLRYIIFPYFKIKWPLKIEWPTGLPKANRKKLQHLNHVENIRKKILRHKDIMEKKPDVIIRIWFSSSSAQNNYLNYGHVSLETISPAHYVSFFPPTPGQPYPRGRFVDYAYDIKNGIPSEEYYQSIVLYCLDSEKIAAEFEIMQKRLAQGLLSYRPEASIGFLMRNDFFSLNRYKRIKNCCEIVYDLLVAGGLPDSINFIKEKRDGYLCKGTSDKMRAMVRVLITPLGFKYEDAIGTIITPNTIYALVQRAKEHEGKLFSCPFDKKIPILSRTTGLNLKDIIPITHLRQLKKLQIHYVHAYL